MKNKLHISISKEHEKHKKEIEQSFKDINADFDYGLVRLSDADLPMQIMIFLGGSVVGGVFYDLLKIGIKEVYKKFKDATITLRDKNAIMYTVKNDMSVSIIVIPDRKKEFWHIKTFDDLVQHLQKYAWQQTKLGNVLKVGSGKDYKHLNEGNIPVFGTGGYMRSVDKPLYSGESVFIGRKGTINKPFYYNGDFWTVDTLFYTYGYKETNAKFVHFLFQTINWLKYNEASGVPSLSKTTIEKIKINLPPLPEQHRIVSILETWDNAIALLKKKIALKKEVKKGLMQKLLSGEVRLPGFGGEWKTKKLGDLCDIGTGKKNNQDKILNGAYPFFVRSPNIERIDSYSYEGEAILIPGEGNIGKIFHYIKGKFDFHQRVYKISDFKNGTFGKYIYFYLLQNFSKATKSDSVKATVDSLRLPTFTNFKVKMPEQKEQESIVAVLDMVDKEIALLEQKLHALEQQKKFLLNNLVTGEIRTPEDLLAHA